MFDGLTQRNGLQGVVDYCLNLIDSIRFDNLLNC